MKVKDVYKKYKDYHILVYGRPLEYRQYTTPFSYLPTNDKELDECKVLDMIIEDREIEVSSFYMDLKYKGRAVYKGTIYVYAKKKGGC